MIHVLVPEIRADQSLKSFRWVKDAGLLLFEGDCWYSFAAVHSHAGIQIARRVAVDATNSRWAPARSFQLVIIDNCGVNKYSGDIVAVPFYHLFQVQYTISLFLERGCFLIRIRLVGW